MTTGCRLSMAELRLSESERPASSDGGEDGEEEEDNGDGDCDRVRMMLRSRASASGGRHYLLRERRDREAARSAGPSSSASMDISKSESQGGSGSGSSRHPFPSSSARRSPPANVPPRKIAPPVAACSPSTLATTQQVAPQIATIGSAGDSNDSNAEVLSVFECPVCLEYMLPPYLQCHSGHLVCGNCRPKLQCCPTCRGPTPNVRNLGLEKIANTVRFPCKFANSGCVMFFVHTDKVEHEETCEFRPYCCPCPGASCKWQGGLTDVMEHLKKIHKSITTLQGEDIVFLATDINLPGAVDWVMMQSCFGFNFMLVLEKQDRDNGQQMFYAVVQLIGAKKDAENFMYRLELSTMRRRLAWEATPRSIHEGVANAIQQSDCLAFDTSTAQLFAENGNLGINVTISMVPDPLMSASR